MSALFKKPKKPKPPPVLEPAPPPPVREIEPQAEEAEARRIRKRRGFARAAFITGAARPQMGQRKRLLG